MSGMVVVGAGMAGLLAAAMLRRNALAVIEQQTELPNNHSAVLRFRSSVMGDTLGVPFKKVNVMKCVEAAGMNPVAAMLSYSLKTNGTATMRSSISANGEIDERFIAPPDLVQRMADIVHCPIHLGADFHLGYMAHQRSLGPDLKFVSTIPMPVLMKLLRWDGAVPDFLSISGYNITAQLTNVDAYATVYVPDRLRNENRISVTGNQLIIETALPHLKPEEVRWIADQHYAPDEHGNYHQEVHDKIDDALKLLGLWNTSAAYEHGVRVSNVKVSMQRYAKILPIDESVRRNFIMWASEEHGVYSLGRYATWRPGLLLDDLVNDVRVIQRLAGGQSSYEHKLRAV